MKPVQERAFFSRLVLEWSDALVPQMHGDSPWNPLELLPDGVFWRYLKNDQLWIGAAAEAIIFSNGPPRNVAATRVPMVRSSTTRIRL